MEERELIGTRVRHCYLKTRAWGGGWRGLMLLVLLIAAGCGGLQLSEPEQAYLRKILTTPTEFEIPEQSVAEAWERAQVFIENYGSTGLQAVTDTLILSASPGRGLGFRYEVRRVPQEQTSRITVTVIAADQRSGPLASRNAGILADYMQTGELPYPNLIAR
jgi:hypothetical protein